MHIWLYILGAVSITLFIYMVLKIYIMKQSIKQMELSMHEIIMSDTNNLITISSSDKQIKSLANSLNKELINLRKQKLQYENGNQELKKIITNISHDMRTPLTVIMGYIEKIEEDKVKQSYIEIVKRKTKELIQLTEQLFDFSKTMDREIKIEKGTYCINKVLEETLANYYTVFKEQNIHPQITVCKENVYKEFDKNTMTRVLENILSNVSKYSDGDLEVILDKQGIMTFSNKATKLDATTVQKIFDRYFTVENAQKSTGLGLAIAKQLVEENGGSIDAKYENARLMIKVILA